jgi:hypothetical protein
MSPKFHRFLVGVTLFVTTTSSFAQPYGNGSAGNVSVTSTGTVINDYYEVAAISQNIVSLQSAPSASLVNKKILIIQMDGAGAGTWETKRVVNTGSPATNDITLNLPVINSYSGQVQIITIPEYDNFTIHAGAVLSCNAWNGHTGGVLVFNVKNTFTNNGVCDVSGKGYLPGSGANGGVGYSGGAGGNGGGQNNPGFNGGNTGTVAYSGIAGGGDGGMFGALPDNTSITTVSPNCPGCVVPAQNISNVSSTPKILLMGGAGKGGDAGLAKAGAGGGGGGAGGISQAGTAGTNGGNGANGGDGGDGGAGGGIIFFAAKSTTLNGPNPKFIAKGIGGTAAVSGSIGGVGGNGGMGGGDCTVGGGGGGGRGGDGGNGGNGGNGGAGGTVYYIYGTAPAPLSAVNVLLSGGTGAAGGAGGNGGAAGVNGGSLIGNSNCNTPPTPPGAGHLQPTGVCDFMCCLNALYALRLTGNTPGTHTPANPPSAYYSSYTDGTTTINVEQLGQHQVLITTGSCYIYIIDPAFANSPFTSVERIFTAGLNSYSYNSGTGIGTLTDGSLSFIGKCGFSRSQPSAGNNGLPGLPGADGGDGVFGGDREQDCTLNISISSSKDKCPGMGVIYVVTATGGSGDYSASPALNSIIPAPPGIFTVIANVTDNVTGCTVTASEVIDGSQNNMYYADIVSENISCFGTNNGKITVLGGSHPLSVSGPAPSTNNVNQPNNGGLFTNLHPGIYTIFDPVPKGCPSTVRLNGIVCNPCTVTITQPDPIAITTQINPVACDETNSGTASALVTGGTAPYSYSWNVSPAQTAATAIGLAPGTYTVTVTDANNCTAVKQVEVGKDKCPSPCPVVCQPVVTIYPAGSGEQIIKVKTSGVDLECNKSYFFNTELLCDHGDCTQSVKEVELYDANNNVPVWATEFISSQPTGTGVLFIPDGITGNYYIKYSWAVNGITCGTIMYPIKISCICDSDLPPAEDILICKGTSTTIGPCAVDGATYSWSSNPAGFSSSLANPVVSPEVTTIYEVTIVNNNSSCPPIKGTVKVIVENCCDPNCNFNLSVKNLSTSQITVCNTATTAQLPGGVVYDFTGTINCTPANNGMVIKSVSVKDAFNQTVSWASAFAAANGTGNLLIPSTVAAGLYTVTYTWGTENKICGVSTYTFNCVQPDRCCEEGQWTSRQISWSNINLEEDLSAGKNAGPVKEVTAKKGQKASNSIDKNFIGNSQGSFTRYATKPVACNMFDTVMEGSTRTFSAAYSCNPSLANCNSEVLVSISTISGDYINVTNQPSPFTQAFSLPAKYLIKYVAKCGGAGCDSCSFTMVVNKNCCAGILQAAAPTIRTNRARGPGRYITNTIGWPPAGHYVTFGNAVVNPNFTCIQGCPTLYNWVRKRNGVIIESGNGVAAPISFSPPPNGEDLILITANCGSQQCTKTIGFYLGCFICQATGGNTNQN